MADEYKRFNKTSSSGIRTSMYPSFQDFMGRWMLLFTYEQRKKKEKQLFRSRGGLPLL